MRAFLEYYNDLLGTKDSSLISQNMEIWDRGKKVSDEQQQMLSQPVSYLEVKKAVFSIDTEMPGQ